MSGLSKLRKRDMVVGAIFLLAIFGKFAYKAYQQIEHNPAVKISFAQARAEHQTKLLVSEHLPPEPLPPIIRQDILEHTSYEGPLGTMGAVATPVGEPGSMLPAVIWVNGGFTGTDAGDRYDIPTNDQGIASFLDRDIIIFKPTLRGMHENPGVFECFYGEVDDIVAAVEHVSKRQDVDPERIYLMGHSTGGTNVLLASLLTDIPAGIVSFGGAPDLRNVYYDLEPYDINDSTEIRLRSAILFTKNIKVPVLYIEGESSSYSSDALRMEEKAHKLGIDFNAAIIQDQDHFSVLRPVKDLLAERIQSGITDLPTPGQVTQSIEEFYNDLDYLLSVEVQFGSIEKVKSLLDAGANPNSTDWENWTPLMTAASTNEDPEMISVLVNAGANPNELLNDDWTPLMLAVQDNRNSEIVNALVRSGAGIDFRGIHNRTALMYAVRYSTYSIVKELVDLGADVNAYGEFNTTPLMFAASSADDIEICRLLIDSGADVNARDSAGNTPLVFTAGWQNDPMFTQLMLNSGAQMNTPNDAGENAIVSAARNSENPEVIQLLIQAGEDVNVQSVENYTPLMYAAGVTENPEIIIVLLEEGVNARITDINGKTALDYAKENEVLNGTKALELLEQATN